jgi:hypothetical protein
MEICTERERLLKEWSRTAAEVSDIARILWKDRGVLPKKERDFIRKRAEASWTACEAARRDLLHHESEHDC